MRQTKNLMDINIDALYNILKQNQGDVNKAMGYKKKDVMVTSNPLALVAEKTKVSKRREKVVVQLESEGSDDEDVSFIPPLILKIESDMNFDIIVIATNYGLFVDNDDDQEIFHDAIESASENFNENLTVSQKDHNESEVYHNDFEENDHLVDKLIKKFNQKIAKCQKHIEKAKI
ncbi:hypothetical protein Tco_0178983 [Tanacetum coccineum]